MADHQELKAACDGQYRELKMGQTFLRLLRGFMHVSASGLAKYLSSHAGI
jgi:hypothetical protein